MHKSREVKPFYEKLNITPILNVGYSFQFNPIEAVFSKVKAVFGRDRLNSLVRRIGYNMDKGIKDAFKTITKEHCCKCVRKSFHLLERAC